jgi:large conductance mechanosensitive channel
MIREWANEFKEFILKGNAFDLAIGVIIGAAFSSIVTSMVDDIIMPPIGFILGGIDFSNYYADLTSFFGDAETPASLDAAQKAGHAVIAYGKFINAVIKLLIIGFVIFVVVKQINRFRRKEEAAPDVPPAPPEDVRLLTEIRDLLAQSRV